MCGYFPYAILCNVPVETAADERAVPRGEKVMIKVKVDWHQRCPSCDTELVVDMLAPGVTPADCPWCGGDVPGPLQLGDAALQEELLEAVARFETELAERLTQSQAVR